MSVTGVTPFALGILSVAVFAAVTPSLRAAPPRGPHEVSTRLDVLGGVSSTEIIVRFKPETMARAEELRIMPRSPGRMSPPASLGEPVHRTFTRWGGRCIRPFYPLEFRYPKLAAQYGLDRTFIIEVPRGTDTPKMVSEFRACADDVDLAETASIGIPSAIPNDPDFELQYGMHNTGQTGGEFDADIDAPEAWDLHTGRPGTVTLAIIDTGVGPHVELDDRLVPGMNFNDYPNGPTIDQANHGTHVAGIAAATGNNGIGVAGVTWGASIMPVRVTNAAGMGTAVVAGVGIAWAADQGAEVCNVSLEFYPDPNNPNSLNTLEASVNYAHGAGALVIAAAGNFHPGVVAAPARFDSCVAVSATTDFDGLASFSNYGAQVELCAPGASIWSTRPNDAYGSEGGTSMASPHVAGLAALIKSYAYYLTNDEIRTILQATVDDLGPAGRDDFYGFGRINAFAALSAVTPSIAIVSSDPPKSAIDARQPFDVDGTDPGGWNSLDIVFDAGAAGAAAEDFDVETDPTRDTPVINGVFVDDNVVTLTFDRAIPVEAWTIITHRDSNTQTKIGFFPGDVDGDGTSTTDDLDALLDALAGTGGPFELWSVDINRSDETNAQDLLREIDLLNGAGEYSPFLDTPLPP